MTFGEKLYRLRKERGMSQEALAQELGVSRQAISRWELGEVAPDIGNVLAVSRLFGVSTDYLLRDECEREADTPAAHRAEQSLQERQAAVGKGFLVRVCCLSPLILFQLGRISVKQGLDYTPAPVTYLLLLQAVFSPCYSGNTGGISSRMTGGIKRCGVLIHWRLHACWWYPICWKKSWERLVCW